MATVDSGSELKTTGPEVKEREAEATLWSWPIARKTLRETFLDMSWHGVPHAAELKRPIWSRLLWGLCVASCLGVFLVMFQGLMSDYYRYPYKTGVESTPTEQLPFPTVSVCNINTFDVSKITYDEALRDVMLRFSSTNFALRTPIRDQERQVLNMSAQQILEDTNPGVNGMIVDCFYDQMSRNCHELFEVQHWSLTRCFTLNVSRLHPANATTALRIVVFINQPGYVVQEDYMSAGVKFFVHTANAIPNLDARTSTASPGFSTHVALNYQQMVMLDYPYKAYGDRYCVKTVNIDTSLVPGGDPYHLMTCLRNRALQIAHRNCSCRAPFETDPSYPKCTLYQMLTCVRPILDLLIKNNVYNASDYLNCPLPCEFENYLPSITFSYYPSNQAEVMLREVGTFNESFDVRDNYLELNFYYNEMIMHKVKHVPEYEPMSLMGSIGGNMGFFLGASMLSAVEIAELVIILIAMLVRCVMGTKDNNTFFVSARAQPKPTL